MIKIEVVGLEEGLEKVIENLLNHTLQYMEGEAIEHAPKDTGHMASQIKGVKNSPTSGDIVCPVSYAGYVEYGTANIKVGTPENPRTSWPALEARGGRDQTMPFMRPAIYSFISHAESMSDADWRDILK